MVDRTTSLCLACSCSLPPRPSSKPTATGPPIDRTPEDDSELFLTPCCRRPICPRCIGTNPRLARYNPCLHCLGGVSAVSAHSPRAAGKARASAERYGQANERPVNVDGGVHDEDVFVLGDDDTDDTDEMGSSASDSSSPVTPPPAYAEEPSQPSLSPVDLDSKHTKGDTNNVVEIPDSPQSNGPLRYYIQPNDTLVGIALKFGVDGHLLCKLNSLPPSTLHTTPHILHTRTSLLLPPTVRAPQLSIPSIPTFSPAEHARLASQRAEKRFQMVTKEADWRVARAYVAVASLDSDSDGDARATSLQRKPEKEAEKGLRKRHVLSSPGGASAGEAEAGLEDRAVDQYLDDEQWEQSERRDGRRVAIPSFPFVRDIVRTSRQAGKAFERKTGWKWPR